MSGEYWLDFNRKGSLVFFIFFILVTRGDENHNKFFFLSQREWKKKPHLGKKRGSFLKANIDSKRRNGFAKGKNSAAQNMWGFFFTQKNCTLFCFQLYLLCIVLFFVRLVFFWTSEFFFFFWEQFYFLSGTKIWCGVKFLPILHSFDKIFF